MNSFPSINGYDFVAVLDQGGSSTVYEAVDIRHDRSVAVKVIDSKAVDARQRSAFSRELRAMGRLSDHPNVIDVYNSGFTDLQHPFIVMPLLKDGSYGDKIKKQGPLAVGEILDLGVKVGSALETAHRRNILHRDIKPNNLLIGAWGEPVLSDFGIASNIDKSQTITNSQAITVAYAAPELLDGEAATVASDIYSFAATLFTLASGEPPFKGDSPKQIIKTLIEAKETPRLPAPCPSELADLIASMMDPKPEARPTTVIDVIDEINKIQKGFGVAPTAPTIGQRLLTESKLTPGRPPLASRAVADDYLGDFNNDDDLSDTIYDIDEPEPEPSRSKIVPILAVAAIGLLLAAGGFTLLTGDDGRSRSLSPAGPDLTDQTVSAADVSPGEAGQQTQPSASTVGSSESGSTDLDSTLEEPEVSTSKPAVAAAGSIVSSCRFSLAELPFEELGWFNLGEISEDNTESPCRGLRATMTFKSEDLGADSWSDLSYHVCGTSPADSRSGFRFTIIFKSGGQRSFSPGPTSEGAEITDEFKNIRLSSDQIDLIQIDKYEGAVTPEGQPWIGSCHSDVASIDFSWP